MPTRSRDFSFRCSPRAITAEQEAADIRIAAVAALDVIDAWPTSTRWRGWPYHQQLLRLAAAVRAAVEQLPPDAGVDDVADAAGPLLGEMWTDEVVDAAVEQLRDVAMRRVKLLCSVMTTAPGSGAGTPRLLNSVTTA